MKSLSWILLIAMLACHLSTSCGQQMNQEALIQALIQLSTQSAMSGGFNPSSLTLALHSASCWVVGSSNEKIMQNPLLHSFQPESCFKDFSCNAHELLRVQSSLLVATFASKQLLPFDSVMIFISDTGYRELAA
jgi:hypothetical protein